MLIRMQSLRSGAKKCKRACTSPKIFWLHQGVLFCHSVPASVTRSPASVTFLCLLRNCKKPQVFLSLLASLCADCAFLKAVLILKSHPFTLTICRRPARAFQHSLSTSCACHLVHYWKKKTTLCGVCPNFCSVTVTAKKWLYFSLSLRKSDHDTVTKITYRNNMDYFL